MGGCVGSKDNANRGKPLATEDPKVEPPSEQKEQQPNPQNNIQHSPAQNHPSMSKPEGEPEPQPQERQEPQPLPPAAGNSRFHAENEFAAENQGDNEAMETLPVPEFEKEKDNGEREKDVKDVKQMKEDKEREESEGVAEEEVSCFQSEGLPASFAISVG